jgi:hypothetical protein
MSDLREMNLHNALNHYHCSDLEQAMAIAVRNLQYSRISVVEYEQAIQSGRLARKPKEYGDAKFNRENEGHPLGQSRHTRIGAADFFWKLSGAVGPESIPQNVVNELIQSLFDCCATVRHQLTRALGRWQFSDAVSSLKELAVNESESDWVREAANEAVNVHLGALSFADTRWLRDPSTPPHKF